MLRHFCRPLLWVFLLSDCLPARAQSSYNFDHIGLDENLSHLAVSSLMQDSRGFIWIATEFGLNRYDGISCRNFYHDENDPNSLVYDNVLNTAEDSLNRIWIGMGIGISCYDPVKEQFLNYSPREKGNRYFPYSGCRVFFDRSHVLWVTHNKGVAYYDRYSGSFRNIPLLLQKPGVLTNAGIHSFFQDRKSRIWLGTSYGIHLLDPYTKKATVYLTDTASSLAREINAIMKIREDGQGRIWAGTWGAGLLILNEQKNKFETALLPDRDKRLKNIVHDQLFFEEGGTEKILLATSGGLFRTELQAILYRGRPDPPDEILSQGESQNNSLVAGYMLKDRQDNIWFGSSNGVYKLDPKKQLFLFSALPGMKNELIVAATPDGREPQKHFWLATYTSLYKLDENNRVIQTLKPPPGLQGINCLEKGRSGFWLGGNKGLVRYSTTMEAGEITHFRNQSANAPELRVQSVLEEREGKLWIGTVREGLIRFDPATRTYDRFLHDSTQPYNLRNYYIKKLAEDEAGNIWIASGKGLYEFRRATGKFQLHVLPGSQDGHDDIQYIKIAEDNTLWIATYRGLFQRKPGADFSRVRFPRNEISSRTLQIAGDGAGNLWVSTENSIVCCDRNGNTLQFFTHRNGLPLQILEGSVFNDRQGRLYFGARNGYVHLDPRRISQKSFSSPPVVTAAYLQSDSSVIAFPEGKKIRIRHNGQLSIDITALNLTYTHLNEYAYKLKGLNEDWIHIGNNRTIRFDNLPPGSYQLFIKSSNYESIWSENPVPVFIRVTPPFWKTWWFISALAVFAITLAYSFYRYRINQVLRLERVRTRIASDLHDDIGATLSAISMYSDVVKREIREKLPHLAPVLDKMGENSRSMVGSMSDIVWAINPQNDEGEKLVDRMEAYAKNLCSVKNVQLQFEADAQVNNLRLTLEQRKNIYLVFKEALNNALKYSGCSLIRAGIRIHRNEIELSITDNGEGFLLNDRKGNGLRNMQMRSSEIKGRIHIDTAEGKGTSVMLRTPIT